MSRYFAITFPNSIFNSTGFGSAPSNLRLSCTYSKPAGISSSIVTTSSFPFSTVFLKLIRYSTSSPSFGSLLLTVFAAVNLPSLYSDFIFAVGSITGCFGSSTSIIALFVISPPTFAVSFTFTLKMTLLSFVSVISGYFTVTFPFSTLSSVGTGLSPTASRLSFTYSKPDGISSSIFTSTNFPPSTVPLKVIRYSISSPSFGS